MEEPVAKMTLFGEGKHVPTHLVCVCAEVHVPAMAGLILGSQRPKSTQPNAPHFRSTPFLLSTPGQFPVGLSHHRRIPILAVFPSLLIF